MGPRRLWPAPNVRAAWIPGNFKSSFLPWRGGAKTRSDLAARLGNRARAWQALSDAQNQAVSDARRTSLPILRDGLLGLSDLPGAMKRMDVLAQRWLVDFASIGIDLVRFLLRLKT